MRSGCVDPTNCQISITYQSHSIDYADKLAETKVWVGRCHAKHVGCHKNHIWKPRGKVVLFSPHPESTQGMEHLLTSAVLWTTPSPNGHDQWCAIRIIHCGACEGSINIGILSTECTMECQTENCAVRCACDPQVRCLGVSSAEDNNRPTSEKLQHVLQLLW